MNDRIKELADLAGLSEFTSMTDRCELGKELGKFAELIILECIEEVYPQHFKDDGVDATNLRDAVCRINEHFGF